MSGCLTFLALCVFAFVFVAMCSPDEPQSVGWTAEQFIEAAKERENANCVILHDARGVACFVPAGINMRGVTAIAEALVSLAREERAPFARWVLWVKSGRWRTRLAAADF